VLALADGESSSALAQKLSTTEQTISKWRRRFEATNGTQSGAVLSANDVPVEDGVFSVPLNFGAFGAEARWLAISVRDGASAGTYEALAPRQAITAAPVAQFALAGNPGPQGPQGPAGVVQIVTVAGISVSHPATPSGSAPWLWAGPFTTVTVSAGQRITGGGNASLGHTNASNVMISASLCISENTAAAALQPFHVDNFPDATIFPQPAKTMVSAHGSRVVSVAGTYRVGFCIRNKSTFVNLTNNDYVNAWFMVTQ
jgi:hypothetical protein